MADRIPTKVPQDVPLPALIAPQDQDVIRRRNQWFFGLEVERKEEKLFELEGLLKGLDRFFNLNNLPIAERDGIVTRDFTYELQILQDTVFRVLMLSQTLLPDQEKSALHFKKYVESRLLNDYQRAQIIERSLLQRTPEESLFILCFSFINFHEIIGNLVKLNRVTYHLFYNLEQLICREIASNRYFNPFRAAGFAPYYDAIQSPLISRIVRGINEPRIKKTVSIIILVLFKMLRFLSVIESDTADLRRLRKGLLLYALLHSESMQLKEYIEKDVVRRFKRIQGRTDYDVERLYQILDSLAFQLDMEFKKIYELELKDATSQTKADNLRNGMTRSKGLLGNIFQQNIIQIAQFFEPELEGREVFRDFISRLEQSIKLRKDLWLFLRIIENLEKVIEENEAKKELLPIMETIKRLRSFIFYYQNLSIQLLRCYDREEFQSFFNMLDGFNPADAGIPFKFEPFKKELHAFKIFLETTLRHVNNRTELQDMPFGEKEGERLVEQFLL